jgi:chaperonin GroES
MQTLENKITLDKDTIASPNLCDRFTDSDLSKIGECIHETYTTDVTSRIPWMRRVSAAMDLAMQVQKDKNYPWPGCSNIAFPLVTIAALQFHSRAYPALIQGTEVVQCRVVGPDPDGSKTERAARVSSYMSWQVLEQDEAWESQQDKALINVPIVGTAFKKTYFSAAGNHNESELVLAKDLVINYWAKSVNSVPKTHLIPLSKNEIHSRILEGTFRDVRECDWYKGDAPSPPTTQFGTEEDNRLGLTQPSPNETTPYMFLEQHRDLDLDDDGYAEPYIVTVEENSHEVVRIVCRFDREEDIQRTSSGEIIRINGIEYFTKIPFIPSPDGSIMDVGFGILLGPLNESVNSAINQLYDAGTMSNTAGGFLGRGAKIRGGVYNFSPFDWNRIDSTGDDIRKSIIPLPVREPSSVMFQLLSLLINYTEKVSGAVDISTGGNPGQNTPAQTSQTMVEQGQKVYAAIFKRVWRSMKQEFQKLYVLNGIHLPPMGVQFAGSQRLISKGDFLGDPSAVIPVADPTIMSDQARFMQAQALLSVGKGNPLFNQDAIYTTFLKAMKIANVEQVYIGTEKAPKPGPSEKVQIEQMKVQVQMQELQWKKLQWMSSLLEQRNLNQAKITSLEAQAALYVQQAGGVHAATQINAFTAAIQALQAANDGITKQLGVDNAANQSATQGQDGAVGQGPVPQLEGPSGNGASNGPPQGP